MKSLILVTTLLVSGCASADYEKYIETHREIQVARSNADAEKYRAMALIAQSGSDTAKVAALISINNDRPQQAMLAPPKTSAEIFRDWVGLIIPAVVQGYSIHSNTRLGIAQSDNNARIAESTNSSFVSMAGKIQAPGSVVTTTTTSTNTLSGTGSMGGDYTVTQPPTVITPVTPIVPTVIQPVVIPNQPVE